MRSFLVAFLLQLALTANGQTIIPSRVDTLLLESKILSESRTVLVGLPDGYSEGNKYPISIVLDGETLFVDHMNIANSLARNNVIPSMIVVGVVNTDRSRDMTHSKDTVSNPLSSGGGKRFEDFISDELIPSIDRQYSTAPFRILSGHSLGGLFSTKLMLSESHPYDAFISMDPALWWNDFEIFEGFEKELTAHLLQNQKLFLSIANSLPQDIQDIDLALKDTSNGTIGFRSVHMFKEKLEELEPKRKNWDYGYYENESHGTVPFLSVYDGLKFIFDFYKRPSFQRLNAETPSILKSHYQMLSDKLGYKLLPPSEELSGLAWRCHVLDKNHVLAFNFLDLYSELYPVDPISFIQKAQYYSELGKQEEAEVNYLKGIELGYIPQE